MIPAATASREFHCPRWPGCQCPDGTVALDCPGRTIQAGTLPASSGDGGPARASDQASPRAPARSSESLARSIDPDEAVAEFRDLMEQAGLGHIVADRVTVLPVRSHAMELLGKAALAITNPPRAIYPDEAGATFRRQMQSPSWPPEAASPSALLKERGEQILTEMRAIVRRADDALFMIQRELEHRQDLLQASRATIVEMGFATHDLARLVRDL